MNRHSKIPVPVRTMESTASTPATERFMLGQNRDNIKLPKIHNYSSEKYLKKNKSYSRLNDIINYDYDADFQNLNSNRPGSMNYPSTTNSINEVTMKRYHSTGHVYPRDSLINNPTNNFKLLDKSSIAWPFTKEDKFTEGYLKMQSLMNAKKKDYLKKKAQTNRLIKNAVPQLPKTLFQSKDVYNFNLDDYDSSCDSTFDTRRDVLITDNVYNLPSHRRDLDITELNWFKNMGRTTNLFFRKLSTMQHFRDYIKKQEILCFYEN
ncbi:hypothetical protein HELRODRAFT_163915 [Helobdella robusta]|uniref:Uncharacterized protein n=1 Tax=Helobdella robusta TaxID=6412 RepID=T1EUM3_HELRO|nr:hypothetical protein HELRODRAFT_163915 [Helobdella robusta]ESN96792.1 hypothetical protein HELRODRAFT_163915 [Helobdella robusta]